MPSSYPAPTETAIEALLAGLVSVPTQVSRFQSPDPDTEATGMLAEFVTDGDQLAVLAFADHDVVNYVGGALAGLEADALEDASDKAAVLDEGAEKFKEIVTEFTACLNSEFTKPVQLREVRKVPAQISDEVSELWREPRGRRAYRVSVQNHAGSFILYFN